MYAPRGFGQPEVGDVEVFPHGDELHLFHLTLPNHDVVQHVVSTDGLAWRPLPNALRTGDPGDCDDDMIWTMSVTERNGAFFMLYTALAQAENGRLQRTALATSSDLIRWTKHPGNPVGAPDPRWYESAPSGARAISWRDPKPIRVGDSYYAAVCARESSGPPLRRGCVGLLASPDLVHWEPRPPLFAPHAYWDLECPQVFQIGEHYYLTAATMEDRLQHYWIADRFEGPYRIPNDGGVLAPVGHYAGRICRWRDLDLYYCWHKANYDWPGLTNPRGKFVVPPLVLTPRPDGSLAARSYPGWESFRSGPEVSPVSRRSTSFGDRAVTEGAESAGGWRLASPGGRDVVASEVEIGDAIVSGSLSLDAVLGGIAFRMDDSGGGYFASLTEGRDEVTLVKWLPVKGDDGTATFRYTVLQRGRLARPRSLRQPIPFRLILAGPYLELSLDGEIVLATLSAERATGRIGIWADSGAARVDELRWVPLRGLV